MRTKFLNYNLIEFRIISYLNKQKLNGNIYISNLISNALLFSNICAAHIYWYILLRIAYLLSYNKYKCDFPAFSEVKNPPAHAGDPSSIPGLGRSPGEGNDNPLQYSCLQNPMDRGAWWAIVHGVAKSWTQLSN